MRLAESEDDVRAAQALRYRVFNLELGEGLAASEASGLDADPFDAVCDHLIVEDTTSGAVVGTYRMQTGARAAAQLGYYSEREFDFAPYAPLRPKMLELGRACVGEEHRSFAVLNLLWNGIAAYAHRHEARYLVGCSSLTSVDPATGAAAWELLAPHRAGRELMTRVHSAYACPLGIATAAAPKVPKLLSAYLALGARICAPPAIDREFGTIDFLTWMDLEQDRIASLIRRGRFTIDVLRRRCGGDVR